MTARRQSSTTSLAKYARASSPDLTNRSFDFCNAFWGPSDGGVDVLFARMRGAGRTMEELRAFWKERAAIEEEYAKRLSKLAKQPLGKDEIGDLRNSLDTLRLETDKQATSHMHLAQQVRNDLENPVTAFMTKQLSYKKTYQAAIEKAFKAKQTQESYVNKAREKYESDCLRINSYTAQSTLVQGKDLEKVNLKLERAKQTVTANERDFANFARALQDTVLKWEKDWKGFCDGCQDMEEERIEFTKDNMWAYANAVSTVCVSDDESCEHIRVALEQFEPDRDMENFVRDYGTGNLIPDPPQFVNYTNPDANPSARPTPRHAIFPRSSQRQLSMAMAMRPPPPEEEPTGPGTAGIGAGGRGRDIEPISRANSQSRASSRGAGPINGTSSTVHSPTPSPFAAPKATFTSNPPSSSQPSSSSAIQAEPAAPTHQTMIKIGENAYPVDADKDPQTSSSRGTPGPSAASASGSGGASRVGDEADPLARQMADLRNAASTSRHSARSPRPSVARGDSIVAGPSSSQTSSALAAPSASASQPANRDYRNSAEIVVGSYPGSTSRPPSPNPPSASFMAPPIARPTSSMPVEEVLAGYEQSFPGERKPISRSNSRAGSAAANQARGRESVIERPVSREGHAGIGAHGRSPSPQPLSGSVSPGLQAPGNRNSYIAPAQGGSSGRPGPGPIQRASSPAVGIALDEQGRVAHDAMAESYVQQQHYAQQRRQSYIQPPAPAPPPQHPGYSPSSSVYQPPPPPQPSYIQPPHTQGHSQQPHAQGFYNPHSPASYTQHTQAHPVYQPPQPGYTGHPNGTGGLHRAQSTAGYYGANPNGAPPQSRHPQNASYSSQSGGFRAPSPAVSPAPAPRAEPPPTGQYTEAGRPVLFYVKALYDYVATIEEEFDFQAGDIIAVTSTPEDGWWTGELLDDRRRVPGKMVFPSNFVCLF